VGDEVVLASPPAKGVGRDVVAVPGVSVAVASASNACRKGVGSSFPRLSARRRIPQAARAERKYFGGAFCSRIEEREQTENAESPLCEAKPLSIKTCPCARIPELVQVGENLSERRSETEQSGHILPKYISRSEFINQSRKLGPEPAIIVLTPPFPGNTRRLTREPADQKIDRLK